MIIQYLHKHDEGHHKGVGQLPAPHRDDGPSVIDKEALLRVLIVDLVLHRTLAVHILFHELPIQSGTSQKTLHQDFRDNSQLNSWIAVEG